MLEQVLARGEDPANYPILNSRPLIYPDITWIWEAYIYLSGSRQQGFNGPQPITLVEVLAYAQFRGIDSADEREELLHHVQRLDQVFLADYAKRHKNQSPQTPR